LRCKIRELTLLWFPVPGRGKDLALVGTLLELAPLAPFIAVKKNKTSFSFSGSAVLVKVIAFELFQCRKVMGQFSETMMAL
jgi:hypothetical protein